MDIKYYNRYSQKNEIEKVYGDKAIDWLYGSVSGSILGEVLCRAPLSVLYGSMQSSKRSAKKVLDFIKNYNIPMDEFLPEDGATNPNAYSSFNDFFIRRFREGKRKIESDPKKMAAFAEARYFGWESITDDLTIPVKGKFLTPAQIIASEKWNSTFEGGPLMIARLCPVDYHRYHYPDNGKLIDKYTVKGKYHSVNPLALKNKNDILMTNIREVSILETENFGKLAYIEVGAMMVGKIIQSHKGEEFKRGEEKGYFLFGGSTVIVVGEKGKWRPSADMIKNSIAGIETYIHLGDQVADV